MAADGTWRRYPRDPSAPDPLDEPRPRHGSERNPRPVTPDRDPGLHPHRTPGRSLVEDLGPVADDMRQLLTDFGLRPYRVFSVVVRWTGGRVGYGEPRCVSERELLPTPRVVLGLQGDMKSAGNTERGNFTIDEISPRYTEDDIDALFFLQPLPPAHEGYWEVRMDRRDGRSRVRRCVPYEVPQRRAGRFDWRCRFRLQDTPPNRGEHDGNPRTPAEVQADNLGGVGRNRW